MLKRAGSCLENTRFIKVHNYIVSSVIAKGAFSTVRRCFKKGSSKEYVMKVIQRQRLCETQGGRTVMFNERCLMPLLNHPHILKVHEVIESARQLLVVTRACQNSDLLSYLSKEDVGFEVGLSVIDQILSAVEYLHSFGICHRDIKLENILVARHTGVKLTDFGLAKDLTEDSTTGSFCGTHEYLAPEVVAGKTYSYAIDWWALGVIAFRLLTGYLPFKSANLSRLYDMIVNREAKYPKKMDEVTKSFLQGLLVKDPLRRMGDEEVLRHPFFAKIDWKMLNEKKYDIRVKPELVGRQTLPSE